MANKSLYLQTEGTAKLRARLAKLKALKTVAMTEAMLEDAEGTIDLCVEKYVPRDFGTLAGSHFVKPPIVTPVAITVVLGFGGAAAPYAEAVHENPRAGKTGGVSPSGRRYKHWADVGEWKYLEKAMTERARGFAARCAARIKRDWAMFLGT